MEVTVCSVDLKETAVVSCACTFPLPSLCEACKRKHFDRPGFHFLLPLSAAKVIQSLRQLQQVQPRLFQLSNTYGEGWALLTQITRCEEQIESAYQEILYFAAQLKTEYKEKLAMLKTGYTEALNKAVQETSEHALEEETYVPIEPIASLLWTHDSRGRDNLVEFKANVKCRVEYLKKAFQVAFQTSFPGLEHLNVGSFPESLQMTVQYDEKIIQVRMESSDSVKTLKAKIEMVTQIPADLQELSYELKLPSDESTLNDYQPEPISHIHLKTSSTLVSVALPTNKIITLTERLIDTIESVKAKIKDQEDIPLDQQTLFFAGKQLKNEQILASLGIEADSILYLFIGLRLRIVIPTGNIIIVDMRGNDTIGDVKTNIQNKTGIPRTQQRLFFHMKELDSSRVLTDCDVKVGSTLYLMLETHQNMKIFVVTSTDMTFVVPVESSDSVGIVKANMKNKLKCLSSPFNLVFGSKLLNENSRSLSI